MTERPILFSAEMVRAILAGLKTQTRRPVKPQPYISYSNPPTFSDTKVGDVFVCPDLFPTDMKDCQLIRREVIVRCTSFGNYHCMGVQQFAHDFCPFGVPGDRLWVRESLEWQRNEGQCTHGIQHPDEPPDLLYCADGTEVMNCPDYGSIPAIPGRVIPSIHMPRWASRITLEVVAVRVERVQEISEADAIAEGFDQKVCAAVFDRAAEKNEARSRCWLETEADGEPFYLRDGSSDDFCEDCAEKLHRPRSKKYRLCGDCGSAGETDGPAFCGKCGSALLVSLTEYGIDRELRIEDDPTGKEPHYFPVSGADARMVHTIADGIGDLRERHHGRLAQIGFATAWDAIYAKGGLGWAANPWVWVVEFKVAQ